MTRFPLKPLLFVLLIISSSNIKGQEFFLEEQSHDFETENTFYKDYYENHEPDYGIDSGGFEDDDVDDQGVPINQNLPFLLLVGLGLGIYAYCIQKNKSSDCP